MILLSYTAELQEPKVEIRKQRWFKGMTQANTVIHKLLTANKEKGIIRYKNFRTTQCSTVAKKNLETVK